jgi:hypothetical protein
MTAASRKAPPAIQTMLAALALSAAGAAFAAPDDAFRLSSFGTFGYTADDRSDIAPARDISQKPRKGAATGGSWRVDSRVGLQLEYRLGANADLVGQVVVRDHFRADFDSSTELAYLTVRPRPNLDLRIGRINYDAFLMSDYRHVGYAYTWVRPPMEFYGWIPIFSLDGADAAYVIRGEAADWRIKAQLGRSRFSIPIRDGYDFKADDLFGLSVGRQAESWRLKIAYSQFRIGSEVPAFAPLHAGLDQVAAAGIPGVSAEAADLRRNLSFLGARISYATLGAAFDDGTWSAQAELGRSTSSAAVVPHASMAFASVGRRFGDWLPYLMLSASRPGNGTRTASADWGALNAGLRDPALLTVDVTRIDQTTASLGVRWDFMRNAALKFQWDRTAIRPSGYGLWWRDIAINSESRRINQATVTLDFSF